MSKAEFIANAFLEEHIRFYIALYPSEFGFDEVITQRIGTPDIVGFKDNKSHLIELKADLKYIYHQIKKNLFGSFNEIWFIVDHASENTKQILAEKNISSKNILDIL